MSTAKDLREKKPEELAVDEVAARKALFETRYKHATRQLEDTASLNRQRKDLARILTIKSEKSRAAPASKKGKA